MNMFCLLLCAAAIALPGVSPVRAADAMPDKTSLPPDINEDLPIVYRPASGYWQGFRSEDYTKGGDLSPVTTSLLWGGKSTMIPVGGYYQKIIRTNVGTSCYRVGTNSYSSVYTSQVVETKFNLAVWDSADGKWYINSVTNPAIPVRSWGTSTMFPVPGDYDGDALYDLAVFDPSTSRWHIWYSGNNKQTNIQWGFSGAVPVPGDYTNDGKTDLTVYDAAAENWYIRRSQNGAMVTVQWGFAGAVPVPYSSLPYSVRKYMAVFHPSTATWYVNRANASNPEAHQVEIVSFGPSTATAVPAMFEFAGPTACYDRTAGTWYIRRATLGYQTAFLGGADAFPAWPQYWINRRYGLQY